MLAAVHAEVAEPSPELRKDFGLDPFYTKAAMVGAFPVVSSGKVSDAALEEAANTIRSMLAKRPDVVAKLAENRIRLSVMAVSERTCDLPEHADLEPSAYWNRRARGLGATLENPCVSCGAENLLNNPGDPYSTESIMVHEFAHAIHEAALMQLDATFDDRLKTAYETAMKEGKWKGLYAAENHHEYWAEAVQSWFDTNRENDDIHNHVDTREELIEYDPAVADLCREAFGANPWRYVRADDPSRAKEPHLKDLNRADLERFAWTQEEQEAYDNLQSKKD